MGTSAHPPSIVSPQSYDVLREQIQSCRTRLLVASPYVNRAFTALVAVARARVSKTLITRLDLRGFASGVSNLDAMVDAVDAGWSVHSLPALHAKLYIVDDSFALVTSANATTAGLHRNLECGLAVTEPELVSAISAKADGWLASQSYPTRKSLRDLEGLRQPVSVYREFLKSIPQPPAIPSVEAEGFPSRVAVDSAALLDSFAGWRRLVLECLLTIPGESFDLDTLYRICAPVAARKYPSN